MRKLVAWIQASLAKRDKEIKAARNLIGDGRIGVVINPEGAAIRWLEGDEIEVVEITGAISGGVYPATVYRWNGSTWVSGGTCEVLPL